MTKVFEHANDLHVVARLIYAKTDDPYAYSDSAKTVKVSAETLEDMFIKGSIIVDGNNQYKPVSILVDDDVATITYVKADTTPPTAAVLATLNSQEYSFNT